MNGYPMLVEELDPSECLVLVIGFIRIGCYIVLGSKDGLSFSSSLRYLFHIIWLNNHELYSL
ncbi:hypothetical protein CQA01_40300 [Cyclobacterium qasimii]|uniref:Uncharacterized protein n=1 Tax=Cyclobacterium qasimii TaxID=1350429 RepID=A0A512CH34_9BACT|nr:hypothetical protein CQA01_40300 [Cyclobacterium qasimii]